LPTRHQGVPLRERTAEGPPPAPAAPRRHDAAGRERALFPIGVGVIALHSARSGSELASVSGSDPAQVAFNAVVTGATAVFADASPPTHLIDLVDQIAPRAVLLIYAPAVKGGLEERFNRAYYREANRPKAIWSVAEADHVGAQEVQPQEYEQRVTRFFDQVLGKEQR